MQFDHMKRREFIALFSAAAAWPVIARAQRPDRMRRIGVLMNVSESDADGQTRLVAFTHRIRELGWTDGDNVCGAAPGSPSTTYSLTSQRAYGKTNHNFNDLNGINQDVSATKVGFASGVGAEYGLDPRWSVKAEALYVDLGKNSAMLRAANAWPLRYKRHDV